jgi:hypothetical protein
MDSRDFGRNQWGNEKYCILELIPECSTESTGMECNWNSFTGIEFNL